MKKLLLALNVGSSSLKFQIASGEAIETALLKGAIDRIGQTESELKIQAAGGEMLRHKINAPDHRAAIEMVGRSIQSHFPNDKVEGIGHRIVHGGDQFSQSVVVDERVFDKLTELIPLAPLHQPHGISGLKAARSLFPGAINVACFDTAFHANKPWVNDAFALPREFYDQGIRRYGFHGISCQSIMRTLIGEGYPVSDRKIVIAHLGNGCSVTAVKNGIGVANSMGFSTLDGVTMGTRTGRIDPGVLLHLLRNGHTVDDLERLLYKESGLLGLSGLSNDMRDLSDAGSRDAQNATSYFVARVIEEISRMAGTLTGLDSVVFCGGIGENGKDIRGQIMKGLSFLPGRTGEGIECLVRETKEEQEILLSVSAHC